MSDSWVSTVADAVSNTSSGSDDSFLDELVQGYGLTPEMLAALRQGSADDTPIGYKTPDLPIGTNQFIESYVTNLDQDSRDQIARAMYAEGLYRRGTEIDEIYDDVNWSYAYGQAVQNAQVAAQYIKDGRALPTLGKRFAKFADMSEEQILEYLKSQGGGGGGGRSIRLPDPAGLRQTFEAAAQNVLGRKATDAEKRMFVAGINSAVAAGQSVDVGARAVEAARAQAPARAGAMDRVRAGGLVLQALGMG